MKMLFKNVKYFVVSIFIIAMNMAMPYAFASTRFVASVSANNVAVGEQIQVTFELQGTGSAFRAPSFAGFNVLMGPSQSSQMSIVNGSMSQAISFTYIIEAIKEGTYKIAAATIESEGKKIQSNELTITVVKGASPQARGAQQKQTQGEEGNANDKNVFFRANIDKPTIYRGEALVVTYKLYTRLNLVNYALTKMPALDGFYSQDIGNAQKQLEFVTEVFDGIQYKSAVIKQMVLFPQRSGNLLLDAMEGEVVARVQTKRQQQSNNPLDFFFNDPFFNNAVQDVSIKLKSKPLKINVHELPRQTPATFNGAIGQFTINFSIDKKEARAHDALNLKIKINGNGNVKLLDPPKIEFPPDFETYDPKVLANVTASPQGVSGTKSFEYLMIPRNAGEYKIAINAYTFFNPQKNKYETMPGAQFVLKIAKGDDRITSAVTGVAKNDIEYLGKDIRFIKTNAPLFTKENALFYRSSLFYLALCLPLLMFVALLVFRIRNIKTGKDPGLWKSRKAGKIALKRLSVAKKFLDQNKPGPFIDEMFRAMWGFVGDKLQIPASQLSKENVSSALAKRNVSAETISLFIQTLDNCDMGRFAKGVSLSNEQIYLQGINIISKLEQEIQQVNHPANSYMFTALITALIFLPVLSHAQEPTKIFQKANEYYKHKNYDSAIVLYNKLTSQHFVSAEVCFNLGNCYYKSGIPAQAILNYERALKIDPSDDDVLFNLKIAQLKTIDKIDPVPQIFYTRWLNQLSDKMVTDTWAVISVISVWFLFLCASIYLFLNLKWIKRISFIFAVLFLLCSLFFGLMNQRNYKRNHLVRNAIVMLPTAFVKSSPDDNNSDLFLLHEGTKITILDEYEEWFKISIANGSTGWLKKPAVEQI